MKKIAITGPESTGKSALAKALALEFEGQWVPEFARDYLLSLQRPYRYEDLLDIALGQFSLEKEKEAQKPAFLFCDTDFLVIYIWSHFKYGSCHPWIEEMVGQQHYDLHLLCDIDLPWEPDPLREHPSHRKTLFNLYLQQLEERGKPYRIVRGTGAVRTRNAFLAVNAFFNP